MKGDGEIFLLIKTNARSFSASCSNVRASLILLIIILLLILILMARGGADGGASPRLAPPLRSERPSERRDALSNGVNSEGRHSRSRPPCCQHVACAVNTWHAGPGVSRTLGFSEPSIASAVSSHMILLASVSTPPITVMSSNWQRYSPGPAGLPQKGFCEVGPSSMHPEPLVYIIIKINESNCTFSRVAIGFL
jgi:hypothetical protein